MVRARTKSFAPDDARPEQRASTSNAVPDVVLSQREFLIQERKGELGRILNRHDSLIREQFMLEIYGLMLLYDPEVAKQDQTNEFLQFKNKHDLMRFMPDAGPSRATRRAETHRISTLSQTPRQSISVPIPFKPSASATKSSAPLPKRSTHGKGKQKEISVASSISAANGIHVSAKARGKRKAADDDLEGETVSEENQSRDSKPSRRRVVSSVQVRVRNARGLSKSSGSSRRSRSHSIVTEDTSSPRPSAYSSQRSGRKSLRDTIMVSSQDVHPKKKRRLRGEEAGLPRQFRITLPPTPTQIPSPSPPAGENRPTMSGKSLPGQVLPTNTASPRPTIKRIKLIVRPPRRIYSSPLQRPSPALYNYSLPALLSSYIEIDGKNQTLPELEAAARRDARILNRLDELRKKGRYPGQKFLDHEACPKYAPVDTWAHVVSEAISVRNSQLSRHRFGYGGVVASQIHARLHAHWDLMKKELEREQILEERRLKALAKSVLKLVVGEWKKAVWHVREQERSKHEEEEARRGRMHLDAILDQSGQILERQQMELVRSESASVNSDDEDGEGSEEEEEQSDSDANEEEGTGRTDTEPTTEVDEEEGRLISSPRPGAKGGRHVEFDISLDDADSATDKLLMSTIPRSALAHSSEVGATVEDEETCSVDGELGFQASSDAIDIQRMPSSDRKPIPIDDHDQNQLQDQVDDVDGQPVSEVNTSFSNTWPESPSSFMEEMRIDDDGEMCRNPEKMDVHPLDMSNKLVNGEEHDQESNAPVVGDSSGPPAPASVSSKQALPTTTILGEIDSERDASVSVEPLNERTVVDNDSKLTNEHTGHDNHARKAPAGRHVVMVMSKVKSSSQTKGATTGQVNDDARVIPAHHLNTSGPTAPLEADCVEERAPDHMTDNESAQAQTRSNVENEASESESESESESDWEAPPELQPFAVAHVKWEPGSKILPPLLLRGTLRPYQQSGLEWLVSLHNNETNGILADEMGLGKTIQTIALLAHLACDRGIWGPHLIIVPTSVLLNWEMEFKKFLPGFKLLTYHGSMKRRKELRRGWNDKYAFNVCITSYTLASRDQHIFKRKPWYYMVLDEAHMIKNFKSQRWNILLMFRSCRRLLLTGTPLQNNLTELWALLRFLMSGANFANQKEFSEWFGIPLEKAIELGNLQDHEVQLQVMKLHEMLRPFLLRRLKKDVEKDLPKKYEHLVLCRLSKRQRFLYDEFMSRRQTREDLQSGVYQKIANILMQLRKVCNHPNLFEVRPIVTSFAMNKSAIADFEIKELLVRRRLLEDEERSSHVNLDVVGLQFTYLCNTSLLAAQSVRSLEEILAGELIATSPGEPPPKDLRTIEGFRNYNAYQQRLAKYLKYQHMVYLNRQRCRRHVLYGYETINVVKRMCNPLTTACEEQFLSECRPANHFVKSYLRRACEMSDLIEKFAFATPTAVARDMPEIALRGMPADVVESVPLDFDSVLHQPAVKLQIAFPDASLLQYDCGKLQELDRLLRERKSGGHRVLIFTQMTRILDILEVFLNYHGYLYLRLDGATKIEDRQYITERFNADSRVFAFIASSRSGGVGINLTGADTVIFYDSDFNPQMDKQCEDRAHRIGQIRDVHIYRFISQYTVEEAMLRKANQKRSLDDIVIQKGDFDWKNFFRSDVEGPTLKASALQKALVEFEDFEDAEAAKIAAREEAELQGEDRAEFGADGDGDEKAPETPTVSCAGEAATPGDDEPEGDGDGAAAEEEEEGGTTVDYMIKFVRSDPEYFREWKVP